MWLLLILLPILGMEAKESSFYDNYYGTPLTRESVQGADDNKKSWCIAEVVPCNPNEGRRLDGSCNNLDSPQRGTAHTPFLRLLAPEFGEGFEPRPSYSGQPMTPSRHLRTTILATGTRSSQTFTQLATSFFVFTTCDFVPALDSADQVLNRPFCCTPKGKDEPLCSPQPIPDDDPVHRFSDVRCMNMTKPLTYQYRGCLRNGTTPERITESTPLFDLSSIYGNGLKASSQKLRLYTRGLLQYDVEDGRVYPPTIKTTPNLCILNELPRETRCHDTPDPGTNSLVGINLFSIWFWRNHNRIASALADLNRCWDDEKLFQTARDINIAIATQIFYYEFLPILLGHEYLVRDSVISVDPGFRDMYDKNILPQITLEFPYVLRWTHLMQEGRLKMYDESGNYLKQIPVVNVSTRTGYLAVDNNIDYITQGSFRQPSAKIDHIIDPEMGDSVFGSAQRASDVGTLDLARGRYFGFPPYVKYREYCYGRPFNTFEDLSDFIDEDYLELLKEVYNNVNDIELLAGVWLEKPVKDGFAPPTFYCLVVEQLLRSMKADRHWYERPNRPNAFSLRQLLEVRKATVSRLLCDVGDKVTKIQRPGFLRAGPGNKMVSCEEIEKMDLTAWKDDSC